MKRESIMLGVIGLLAGLLIAGTTAVLAVNNDNHTMMGRLGMDSDSHHSMMDDSDMSMADMSNMLKGKTGDDFDESFIGQMIVHHQGAIDMALLAKNNAKHDEVKKLAEDILSAQSREIDMMQSWQSDWGYKSTNSTQMNGMSH